MTPVEKFNAIRRDVIDMLILAMCGVAFYVSYQDRNSPVQSDSCSEASAKVFAANKITKEDADAANPYSYNRIGGKAYPVEIEESAVRNGSPSAV